MRANFRILEVGCGPGVAAREISRRLREGKILAIDRSAKAIRIASAGSKNEIATGRLEFRNSAIENFQLEAGEGPFDLAFAMRVGALDGRHPEVRKQAMMRLKAVLKSKGLLCIDGLEPIRRAAIDI